MHFYKFHITDYRSATAHLSNDEDLCYRRLIDMYYDTEDKIPLETKWVARRIQMNPEVVDIVLQDFFILHEDGWYHARCDEEIVQYHNNREKWKANGGKGGRPKKTKRVPNGNQTVTKSKPILVNGYMVNCSSEEEEFEKEKQVDVTAEAIYNTYPLKKGRAAAIMAIQKALKKVDTETLLEKVEIFAAKWQGRDKQFCPHPATWFNGDRWLDEDLAQSQVDFIAMDREEGKKYIAKYLVQAGVRNDDPYPAAIQKIQTYYDNGGFEI